MRIELCSRVSLTKSSAKQAVRKILPCLINMGDIERNEMIRYGKAPFLECSSRGDTRFSAFFARLSNGRTIEAMYQAAKVFEDGSTNLGVREAKGKKAVNMPEVSKRYSELWDQYFKENPDLIPVIIRASGISDIFGQPGHNCQATEIWRIRKQYSDRYVN